MSSAAEGKGVCTLWAFRGTEYLVSSSSRDNIIEVEVEETLSMEQWKGRFEAKHVEELTRKTGNFKQFHVFVAMLESAINKSSESVTLDLLTYSDLEALRDKRNGHTNVPSKRPSPAKRPKQLQAKRYLILTYSVEFDRIHYPLALSHSGKADGSSMRQALHRMTSELHKYKKLAAQAQKNSGFTKLQKAYDALRQEKAALEDMLEAVEEHQPDPDEHTAHSQLQVLQKVVRNLEEELLRERSKHQRYVSKKTEEMRGLIQELEDLRSSERTLRARVKNLTHELSAMRRGLRSSPSNSLPRRRGSSSSLRAGTDIRQHSYSKERRPVRVLAGKGRLRTPSPRDGTLQRFDPTAYVEGKKKQQKEVENRFGRMRSPSYQVARSRSSSVEQRSSSKPPLSWGRLTAGSSRKLWGSTPEKGTRTRSSSVGSLTGRSSNGSSRASSRHPSLTSLSSMGASSCSSRANHSSTRKTSSADKRKRGSKKSKNSFSLHSSSPKPRTRDGSLLDHSAEISEIDARLNALQQFMKRSLEITRAQSKR